MLRRFHGLFFAFILFIALSTESFHVPHAKTTTRQKSPVLLRVIDGQGDSRERGQGAKPKSFSFTPFLSPSAKLFESAEISGELLSPPPPYPYPYPPLLLLSPPPSPQTDLIVFIAMRRSSVTLIIFKALDCRICTEFATGGVAQAHVRRYASI